MTFRTDLISVEGELREVSCVDVRMLGFSREASQLLVSLFCIFDAALVEHKMRTLRLRVQSAT